MDEDMKIFDTVIIGSGPAGLTAAIYTARADLKTVVIAGNRPGGQCTITTVMDNFPGFPEGIGGFKLVTDMQKQAVRFGAEIKQGIVKEIKNQEEFEIVLENGEIITTKSVVLATGAQAKWLGLPKEKELIGKGVSGCATCDGMFFRDKIVAVIGGGNVACQEAVFLAKFARKVYLIHRRDQLRASATEQKRALDEPKIELVWNSEVIEIIGESKVESLKVKNNVTGEEKILPVDGMFVAIGHTPSTDFVKGLVELMEDGHVVIGKNKELPTMTSVEGIFAAGDCVNEHHKQAIIAAGDGAKAALDLEKWIGRREWRN
ncbi:MAG: thioredoxin-disulfide reductase [Candidatus Shapirobacteria bacterium]